MKICASIMEATVDAFLQTASMARGADLIELRIDGLEKQEPGEVERLLRGVKGLRDVPIILTNRPKTEGGMYRGSEKKRIELLLRCMSLADLVDIELSTKEDLREKVIQTAREGGTEVIVSHHVFDSTPPEKEMLGILKKLSIGDIAKLAVKANSMEDVLSLLTVTLKASEKGRVCTIAMGETGRITRVIAPFFGSEITYASVGKETAPGQIPLSDLMGIMETLG